MRLYRVALRVVLSVVMRGCCFLRLFEVMF